MVWIFSIKFYILLYNDVEPYKNIYKTTLEAAPLILFGNESHGLSKRLDPHIRHRISIPSFSQNGKGSESLNVASSVAVVCSEIKRID